MCQKSKHFESASRLQEKNYQKNMVKEVKPKLLEKGEFEKSTSQICSIYFGIFRTTRIPMLRSRRIFEQAYSNEHVSFQPVIEEIKLVDVEKIELWKSDVDLRTFMPFSASHESEAKKIAPRFQC